MAELCQSQVDICQPSELCPFANEGNYLTEDAEFRICRKPFLSRYQESIPRWPYLWSRVLSAMSAGWGYDFRTSSKAWGSLETMWRSWRPASHLPRSIVEQRQSSDCWILRAAYTQARYYSITRSSDGRFLGPRNLGLIADFASQVVNVLGFRMPYYKSPTLLLSLGLSVRVLWQLLRNRPDVIHVSSPGMLVFAAILYSKVLAIPLVSPSSWNSPQGTTHFWEALQKRCLHMSHTLQRDEGAWDGAWDLLSFLDLFPANDLTPSVADISYRCPSSSYDSLTFWYSVISTKFAAHSLEKALNMYCRSWATTRIFPITSHSIPGMV